MPAVGAAAVSVLGWRLIPIFKGRQAPRGGKPTDLKIVPAQAAAGGTWAAGNAAQQLADLGMVSGSAVCYYLATPSKTTYSKPIPRC